MNLKFYLAPLVMKFISKHRSRIACYTDSLLESCLCRLSKNELPTVSAVIDVRASGGPCTERVLSFCSTVEYLIKEAKLAHEEDLKRFCAAHCIGNHAIAAACDRQGQVYFEAQKNLGGKASHTPTAASIKTYATALDAETSKHKPRSSFY